MLAKECAEEFRLECELRRLSKRTSKGYINNTMLFLNFVEKQCGMDEIETIKAVHNKQYVSYLISKDLTPSYINGILKCLRAFFKYVKNEEYIILNMGMVENTLTGNLVLTVMLAFAEYERGMIVERTQAGRVTARQDPHYREGRPKKYLPTQIHHALELLKSGKTYRQVEALTGISKSTLMRAKMTTQ